MGTIVQKFGGTSVADSDKILRAARRAIAAQAAGNEVVIVVSAMGKTTDALEKQAAAISRDPPPREMDLLLSTGEQQSVALMAMAIHELGAQAVGFTGVQLGIRTDSEHTVARIQSIRTERIRAELDAGRIVVAAGFQGIDENHNITTLGRGGSDTTAVALAAALGAHCHIYTDVDGVYTIDPRLVPTARKLERISYDEMLELASLGAGVMHSRSIEFAKKSAVPVEVRSSARELPGTQIGPEPESRSKPVCGAAIVKNEARVTILGVPDRVGSALHIFSAIAAKNIPVDMVVQNQAENGTTDISFTVMRSDLTPTLRLAPQIVREVHAEGVTFDDDVSKISIVGLGMEHQTGVASLMFRALADAGINIIMITTSVIKISVLVESRQARAALWALHQAFALDQPPEPAAEAAAADQSRAAAASDSPDGDSPPVVPDETVRDELERAINEQVTVDEPVSDSAQALITISGVPDQPGLAAGVFEGVAAEGVLVDMIVQDAAIRGKANLSFTVPREDLARTRELAGRLAAELNAGRVAESAEIDILSVSGVGLRSHTGVAIPMFKALAGDGPESGINVRLINTSEVCVSVIVNADDGQRGLERIKRALIPGS